MPTVDDLDNRHIAWIAAWSLIGLVAAGVAVPVGLAAQQPHSTGLLWWVVGVAGLVVLSAIYMVLTPFLRTWPFPALPVPTALVAPVPPGHLSGLRTALASAESAVERQSLIAYGDEDGRRPVHREAVAAHFSSLAERLNHWDDLLRRLSSNKQIVENHLRLTSASVGIVTPDYDVEVIVRFIRDDVIRRASSGRLGDPLVFQWIGFDNGWIMPNGYPTAWLVHPADPSVPLEEWRATVKKRLAPIQELADNARDWEESRFITKLVYEQDTSQPPLIEELRLLQHQEVILSVTGCPICDINSP